MARTRVKPSRKDIERMLRDSLSDHRAVDEANEDLAERARDYWKSIAPVRSGQYRDSIHVEDVPDNGGLPKRAVVSRDYKAHWIEYGTGEPVPTEEFAPAAKTALRFGGTV